MQGTLYLSVLVLLLFPTWQTLSVYNYASLKVKNERLNDIPYSIANFGFVPFGKTMIAKLMITPAFELQCKMSSSNANFQDTFMLIPRGECPFVTKALNAQAEGAQMAIITDDEDHKGQIIMKDNGYGSKVKIPSIFINHSDGEMLRNLIKQSGNAVVMKIVFENKKSQKVDLVFWFETYNRHSYRLAETFNDYYKLVADKLNFSVIYGTSSCPLCNEEDCYHQKSYCSPHVIHDNNVNGRLLLNQQITEKIIFEEHQDQWWAFLKYIDEECPLINELAACGIIGMQKLGIDHERVQAIFDKSFDAQGDNKILKKDLQNTMFSGYKSYPGVTINGNKMKASMNAEFIFDDICNTLWKPPASCTKYVTDIHYEKMVTNAWEIILFAIVLGIILFSVIFCLYRRYMKRKISGEMKTRVDDMVSKYIEFYSQRTQKQQS